MKKLRTTRDYADAVSIIKECYEKNGGTPLPGSIRTYCHEIGKDDQASIVTMVHATLLKLGLMVRENGRYRFTDDPLKHTDAIINRALADKQVSQQKYAASLAAQQPEDTAARILERIKRDTETLRAMGYNQDEKGWYREIREYL